MNVETTDISIRSVLVDNLWSEYDHSNTAIFSEYTLSNTGTRADVVLINGHIHGFELKSDVDSLQRLKYQVPSYNTVFDRITLVVGKRHLLDAFYYIPDWWGVILAKKVNNSRNISLFKIRDAIDNPFQDMIALLDLLSQKELLELTKVHKVFSNSKPRSKAYLERVLYENVPKHTLKNGVRKFLSRRGKFNHCSVG